MSELALPAVIAAVSLVVLGSVYLWSDDSERRERALRLIRLLRGR